MMEEKLGSLLWRPPFQSGDVPSEGCLLLVWKVSWDAGPQDLGGAASQAADLMGQAPDPTEATGALPRLISVS